MSSGYWLIFGLFLIGIEVAFFSGEFLLWIGLGSLGTAFVLFFVPTFPLVGQAVIFGGFSFVCLFLGKRWMTFKLKNSQEVSVSALTPRSKSMIGREFILDKSLVGGRGHVRIGDIYWLIEGNEILSGTRVIVTRIEGNILCVEKKT